MIRKIIFISFLLIRIGLGQVNSDSNLVAEVGKYKITETDFIIRYSDFLLSTGINDNMAVRQSTLNNMIYETLLENYDDNKKIFNDPEFKNELEWAKKQTILSFLKDREIYAKISVTEDELREAFLRVNQKVSARHLFARTEDEAYKLYNLVKNGVSFEVLAEKVFTDSVLKHNGGYLGYFTWGDMDPDFEDAAYSMNPGDISIPVKTKYGYSIIYVEDKITVPILTESEFVKKKKTLERLLKISKKKPAEKNYLSMKFNLKDVKFTDKVMEDLYKNLAAGLVDPESPKLSGLKNIAVTYKNKKYTKQDILKKIKQLPEAHKYKINSLPNLNQAVAGFILQEILLDEASRKGYDKNPEVLDNYTRLAKQIFLQRKQEEITDNAVIDDSVTRKYYNENKDLLKSPDEVNVQEIIVENVELADSIKKKIDNGEDFGNLAKKYSIREYSKNNNGVLGFSEVDKFGLFKDRVWNSEKNNVIGPLLYEGRYAILKVLDKEPGKVYKYEDIKEDIADMIKLQQQYTLTQKHVDEISKNVTIKRNINLLSKIKLME